MARVTVAGNETSTKSMQALEMERCLLAKDIARRIPFSRDASSILCEVVDMSLEEDTAISELIEQLAVTLLQNSKGFRRRSANEKEVIAQVPEEASTACMTCGRMTGKGPDGMLQYCQKCKRAWYCSRECQVSWNSSLAFVNAGSLFVLMHLLLSYQLVVRVEILHVPTSLLRS